MLCGIFFVVFVCVVFVHKVTHVGEMVDRHILSETLEKQKRAFRRRTLPPTLRQVCVCVCTLSLRLQ